MKKAAFIVLSFLISMFFSTQVTYAEENICKYEFSYKDGVHEVTRRINIVYDESNFVSLSLTDIDGNSVEHTEPDFQGDSLTIIQFHEKFTFDKWMESVNTSKSPNHCPYGFVVGVKNTMWSQWSGVSWYFYVQDGKYGGDEYDAFCINCTVDNDDPIFGNDFDSCDTLIGPNVMKYINTGMNYIKIIVPILVIAFGTFDFVRAVLSSSEDDMKKNQKTFVRRLIIALLIFLSPYLVNLLINITNNVAGFFNGGTCGIS